MRLIRAVQIALALCLLQGTVSALPSDPLPEAIRTREADGRLPEVRKHLETLNPPLGAEDLKAHLELIDKTTNLLAVVDAYLKSGLTKQAIDALTAFLPSVSQARDAGLAIAVQRRLAELQTRSPAEVKRQEAIEQAARAALTRADTYFTRGLYQKAKDAYDAVAKQTDPISEDTKVRAKLRVENATQKLFDEEPYGTLPTVYRSLRDAALTVWQWALTFVVVLAIIFVLRRIWLINTRSLELVDATLPVASAAANRELAQELQDVIDRIREAGLDSPKLDASGIGDVANEEPSGPSDSGGQSSKLPPANLVFVTPPVDAPELARDLDAFVSSTPTIQVAGIGFNPQQLWTFIKRAMTPRPRHAFTGTLTAYDNTLTLRLMHEDRLFGSKTEWRAFAPSAAAGARISCLVDIASRLVLDGKNTSTATSDCHSLKEYILGLYALTANTADAFKKATAHFQDAFDRDSGNWLARFQLALCARDRRDTAARHLTWFTGPEAVASKSLQAHIKRHPDFPYVVQYQLASTMSLASEDREDPDVGRILDGLIALETNADGEKLEPAKRLRLVMLARSGKSSREAVRVSLDRDDPAGNERAREARERLRAHVTWFDEHASHLQRAAPSGHPLARGVVLHAYGRVQFSSGDRNGAIESLTEAADLMPTYADVRVDLAKAHLDQKRKADWPWRVTSLLDSALALDPGNAKAKFVYARFYFAEETRNYAKAEPYLTAAPFDPVSLFMLAQVLINRGGYAESLGVLERAIALQKDGPTFRVRLYANALLELVKGATDTSNVTDPKPNLREMERARRQLCAYDKRFDDNERRTRNYQQVVKIYADICARLKVAPGTCFQLAPPPVAVRSPEFAASGDAEPATT